VRTRGPQPAKPPTKPRETAQQFAKRVGAAEHVVARHLAGEETDLTPWVKRELDERRDEENR
jgi:hypothetical protein